MKTYLYVLLFVAPLTMAGCSKVGTGLPEDASATIPSSYASTSPSSSTGGNGSSAQSGGTGQTHPAGVITAGEWNDLAHWSFWQDLMGDDTYQKMPFYWGFHMSQRVSVQITGTGSEPVIDALVQLKADGRILSAARTDNQGDAELWVNLSGNNANISLDALQLDINNGSKIVTGIKEVKEGTNKIMLRAAEASPRKVDICFVVDATGSMGDELEYLKSELYDVVQRAQSSLPEAKISLSSLFYRDNGDSYLTKASDFSEDIRKTVDFIKQQEAGGGGDFPEAVDIALDKSVNGLAWSTAAKARILFLILDAPPHHTSSILNSLHNSVLSAEKQGIKIIPVTASGIDKDTEYLMRFLAIATGGTYVFITDDSGVGNSHLKPTIGKYTVEYLNNLMVRLITKYAG